MLMAKVGQCCCPYGRHPAITKKQNQQRLWAKQPAIQQQYTRPASNTDVDSPLPFSGFNHWQAT
jgi:hypothetical protein